MDTLGKDREIILSLAEKVALIAKLPEQKERINRWKKLNSLNCIRPLVIADEIPWHEMDYDGFLKNRTQSLTAQRIETQLRQTIYRWENLPLDMVVDDKITYQLSIHDQGYGVDIDQELLAGDESNPVVSHHMNPVLKTIDDVEKIKISSIEYDIAASEESRQIVEYLCGGTLCVVPEAVYATRYFGPVDYLGCWMGVQELLLALASEPELIHAFLAKITAVTLDKLEQYERLGLLSLNNACSGERVGTGGLGYTDELPSSAFDGIHVEPRDMWGSAAAQMFSEVSPCMHDEFALEYESKYLSLFGLTYYGCCDPLHHKIGLLTKKIPNLRKISMSPWADIQKGANQIGNKYVMSIKPHPAVFAYDRFDLDLARHELEEKLTVSMNNNCISEVIIKDISTVRYEPNRLIEWAKMAMNVVNTYE